MVWVQALLPLVAVAVLTAVAISLLRARYGGKTEDDWDGGL